MGLCTRQGGRAAPRSDHGPVRGHLHARRRPGGQGRGQSDRRPRQHVPRGCYLSGRRRQGQAAGIARRRQGRCREHPERRLVGHGHQGRREVCRQERHQGRNEARRAEEPDARPEAARRGVVLLPFEEGKPTNLDQWAKSQWTCQPDGSILARGGDIKTNKEFGSFKLHVELRVPFMPAARGQGRGNSGVYVHGRYEIPGPRLLRTESQSLRLRGDLRHQGARRSMRRCRLERGRLTTSTSRRPSSTPPAGRSRAWSSRCSSTA